MIGIRRLIYGFQKQTRETIWQYMDELATDSDIYSKELKDFCPEVANDRLFVYASNHNLVVVLLDTSGREEKTGPEARVKAVFNIIETRLENSRHYVSLFGVVLTGKTIKEPALSPLDEEFAEIKVFDKMTNLKRRRVKLYEDRMPYGKVLVEDATNPFNDLYVPMGNEDNEEDEELEDNYSSEYEDPDGDFDALLKKFIDHDFEQVDEEDDDYDMNDAVTGDKTEELPIPKWAREEKDEDGVCTSEGDWKDVQHVCELIDIPYYSVNFAKEYWDRVFTLFLDEYRAGRTPNPDVLCNREIKFKAFLDFAMQLGAEKIATGHFVQTDDQGHLLKGVDPNKEQSYFLYMLKSGQLKKSIFPVGGMTKAQVREIAEEAGLPVAKKKDSTGICFIGERRFKPFLKQYLPAQPGDMVTTEGETVGRHDGLMYYTLGQRRGLGIGGHGDGRSYFVVDKDMKNNRLIVAQGEDHPLLYARGAVIEQLTWIDAPAEQNVRYGVKTRYRQPDQGAVIREMSDDRAIVMFDEQQRAVTPGQSLVIYQGEVCLGGGIICDMIR